MSAKGILSVLGGVASAIGIGWVIYLAWLQRDSIAELEFPLWEIGGYAFFYAISLIMLAWNWADIVHIHDGPNGAPKKLLRATFLRSQVWKYLPGNVFHYVGRHMAGKIGGSSSAALMKSTVVESVVLVTAALLLSSGLLLSSDFRSFGSARGNLVWLSTGAGLLTAAALSIWYLASNNRWVLKRLAIVMVRALLFITTLGILTCFIVGDFNKASLIIGATSLAWLVGFATPGSPGGLGTREAILVLLLGPALGEPAILGASLALRAVTMGGDLLACALGIAIRKSQKRVRLPTETLT